MKKQLKALRVACALLPFVLFTKVASAQFSGGVRAGVNFATEQYTGYEHEFLALPYGGLYAQYQAGWIAFQLGANYSGQGTNLKDLGSGDTFHARQSYLTVPLMVQGHFSFGGYIELGAQYGFLLSSSETDNGGNSVDTKDLYKSTDVEVGGGIGYEFNHASASGLGINIRYMRGVTSIAKSDVYTDNDIKNRVLSAGLTYRF